MTKKDIYELLEECLRQMQSGTTLEEALRSNPQQAAELRPLLEASMAARSLRPGSVPATAQNRSRAQFLTAAAAVRQPARRGLRLSFWPARALVPALILLIVLVSSLFATGFVSAQSLPGDGLYPVKIAVEQARLSLTTDVASRLSLEESFDQRRVMEVAGLLKRGEARSVSFAGFLSRPEINAWRVAGIPIVFSAKVDTPIVSLVGTYVEVSGKTSSGQVDVSQVQLRLFHVSGQIEKMNPQLWQVNGVPVKIAPETHILGSPALGRQVQISAIRVATDRLLALAVRFVDQPPAKPQEILPPAPSATSTVTDVPPTPTAAATLTPFPTLELVAPTALHENEFEYYNAPTVVPHDSGEDSGSSGGGGGDHHEDNHSEDGGSHD